MNQSEIWIVLRSGAGIRVQEAYGTLDIAVLLPPSYNMTYKYQNREENIFIQDFDQEDKHHASYTGKCELRVRL